MSKKILSTIFISFFLGLLLFGETSFEYKNKLTNSLTMTDVQRDFSFTHYDSREYQENKIEISMFMDKIRKENYDLFKIEPLSIELDFSYFGFYKTSSGTWIGKSNIEIEITDIYNSSQIKSKKLSTEIVFKKKWRLKVSTKEKWSGQLIKKVKQELFSYLNKYIKDSQNNYKSVVSFGKCKIDDKDEQEINKIAILDALRQGCVDAWGVQLESTTTLIDLADVEEKTTSVSKGLVIKYKVLDEFTKQTDDNYLCIVVESIILNPYK